MTSWTIPVALLAIAIACLVRWSVLRQPTQPWHAPAFLLASCVFLVAALLTLLAISGHGLIAIYLGGAAFIALLGYFWGRFADTQAKNRRAFVDAAYSRLNPEAIALLRSTAISGR